MIYCLDRPRQSVLLRHHYADARIFGDEDTNAERDGEQDPFEIKFARFGAVVRVSCMIMVSNTQP